MPKAGGYTFIAIYMALQAYLLVLDSEKPNPDPLKWTADEIEIIRKYHLALTFPYSANIMSLLLNGFRLVGLLFFTPLLLWNKIWLAAAVAFIGFFMTGSMAVRLDPFFFLADAVRHGRSQYAPELELLKNVSERSTGSVGESTDYTKNKYSKSQSHARPNDSAPDHIIIRCDSCGQKLRIPTRKEMLKITCPSCKYTFHFQDGSAI